MSASTEEVKRAPQQQEIRKSPLDEREYRAVVLPNGLEVLLIQDKTTDTSAACMDVNVGYFCDPVDLPGLAHFCEHMLFLGTEKYPDENAYSSYLSQAGGNENAYTNYENTNYYFDCKHDALEGALDRFAQFFIAPLFTASATERELNAVHNENAKNLQNDARRMYQFVKATSDSKHPFSKFSTGNLETLRDTPASKGIDVRQALMDFHAKYYSANLMKLVVVGRESLDDQEAWVTAKFTAVPNKQVNPPTFPLDWAGDGLGKYYEVVPIKDKRRLDIVWPVPCGNQRYKVKAGNFVSNLLGHEGKGSILSLLKQKAWVTSLSAYRNYTSTSCIEAMNVTVEVTEKGMDFLEDIVSLVFQYIRAITTADKSEWKRIWDENAQLNSTGFRYQDKVKAIHACSGLANSLQQVPVQDILCYNWLYEDYDETVITAYLAQLTPANMRVHMINKHTTDNKTAHTERWYGTQYNVVPTAEKFNLARFTEDAIDPALFLYEPNQYIAQSFAMVGGQDVANPVENDTSSPLLLTLAESKTVNNDKWQVWYKTDMMFPTPKIKAVLYIKSHVINNTALNEAQSALFLRMLDDSLSEILYPAELAGCRMDWNLSLGAIKLTFRGYSDKLHVVAGTVAKTLTTLQIDADRFTMISQHVKDLYTNQTKAQPYSHVDTFSTVTMKAVKWSFRDKIACMPLITVDTLAAHGKAVLQTANYVLHIHGNTNEVKAMEFATLLRDSFNVQTPISYPASNGRSVQFAPNTRYLVQFPGFNAQDANSCCLNSYFVGEDTIQASARVNLLCQFLDEPFYDQLRTKEQLGYLVWSYKAKVGGLLWLRCLIQSGDKTAQYLDARIETFLLAFRAKLAATEAETFQTVRDAVIAETLKKPVTLSAAANRAASEIETNRLDFQRRETLAVELKTLSLLDVLQSYDSILGLNHANRTKVSVHSQSSVTPVTPVTTADPADPATTTTTEEEEATTPEVPAAIIVDANSGSAVKDTAILVNLTLNQLPAFKASMPCFPDFYA